MFLFLIFYERNVVLKLPLWMRLSNLGKLRQLGNLKLQHLKLLLKTQSQQIIFFTSLIKKNSDLNAFVFSPRLSFPWWTTSKFKFKIFFLWLCKTLANVLFLFYHQILIWLKDVYVYGWFFNSHTQWHNYNFL